jgi:predicted nucleic acid-binding Zn ribbon protein
MIESRRCPVCQERDLRPDQSVCSPRCRTRQWRAKRTARIATLREELIAMAALIEGMLPLLAPRGRRG